MGRRCLAAAALLAVLAGGGCSTERRTARHAPPSTERAARPAPRSAEWQTVEGKDCGFTAMMPGKPEYRADEHPGSPGYRWSQVYVVTLGTGYGYAIDCGLGPSDALRRRNPEEVLTEAAQRTKDNALRTTAYDVIDDGKITLGSCPGRQTRFRQRVGGTELTIRAYMGPDRIYTLLATTPPEHQAEEYSRRFFDSFNAERCRATPSATVPRPPSPQ